MTPDYLRRMRSRCEITQQDAAELVGVDEGTWKELETGKQPISRPVARLIRLMNEAQVRTALGFMGRYRD